jgi:hypothetical protein
MNTFRYPMEQAIIIGCADARMITPSEIRRATADPMVVSSRIYIVARRPRLRFRRAVAHGDGSLEVQMITPDDGAVVSAIIKTDKSFETVAEEGGNFVRFEDSVDGSILFDDRPSRLLHDPSSFLYGDLDEVRRVHSALLDLEVLYVGKSDDEGGVARSRLVSHSTLQQILANHLDHAPDYELWVLPLAFNTTTTLGATHPGPAERLRDPLEEHAALYPAISPQALVALAEAALIRLFMPEYNKHFKDTFPSRDHSSYGDVFPYDYNSLGVNRDRYIPWGGLG